MSIKKFFSNLFSSFTFKNSYLTLQEIFNVACDISYPADRDVYDEMFKFDIVGESNYQLRLNAYAPDGLDKNVEFFKYYFIARLELEDDNKYDKNAVAVKFDGYGHAGYLDKASAKKWRNYLNKTNNNNKNLTVRAMAVGGINKSIGVKLDLTL